MSEVILDETGRVEIPADIRARYGLLPGSKLEIETNGWGEIHLRPVAEELNKELAEPLKLIRKNGVLVASVEAVGNLEQAVEHDRAARLEKLMGDYR